jgi:hypothetical protein
MILFERIMAKCKAVNAYIWCNKAQILDYVNWFLDHDCSWDLITWHKTNPTPLCSNKYLSDTEYIIYGRARGVKLYGSYETKRKWYVSPLNTADKKKWGHPTIKPLDIVQTLIENSTLPGDVVLDPFMGSGTTAVACKRAGRAYLGFEVSVDHYATCMARIGAEGAKGTLESWGRVDADRPGHVPGVPVAVQERQDRGYDRERLARRRCLGCAGGVLVPLPA